MSVSEKLTITCLSFILLSTVSTAALRAQPSDCSAGIIHDDGSFEGNLVSQGLPVKVATRFATPEGPGVLERVCVCWQPRSFIDDTDFEILVFDDDGPGGQPGTLLGSKSVEVSEIPAGGSFFGFDVSNLGIPADGGALFIGVDPLPLLGPGLCADTDGPGAAPIFLAPAGGSDSWQAAREQLPELSALGIRASFEASGGGPPTGPCVPGPTTLCIDDRPGDRRFRVEVGFDTAQGGGASGEGRAVPLGSLGVGQGGLFWFFQANNPEMLIKVLRGCPVNGHYWVFYSAATNVGLDVRVTDTTTGRSFVRTNPDGTPAPAVQEVTAFPCD